MKFTVFTPTYNRKYCIENLYRSLKKQTFNDFEWLIIDDGSVDGTDKLIKNFIKENKMKIRYIHKENGGKFTCINEAIKQARGELFFTVDSDDYLVDNALEKVVLWYDEIKILKEEYLFIGVAGLRGYSSNEVIGTKSIEEVIDATPLDYRHKYKIKGDRAEVFLTEKLKKYSFPEIKGIKNFQPEGILFNEISKDNQLIRWHNEIIYITEYLEDGLTKNSQCIKFDNWNAYVYYYNQILRSKISIKEKLRELSNYYRIGFEKYSFKKMSADINYNKIFILAGLIGSIYFIKDRLSNE